MVSSLLIRSRSCVYVVDLTTSANPVSTTLDRYLLRSVLLAFKALSGPGKVLQCDEESFITKLYVNLPGLLNKGGALFVRKPTGIVMVPIYCNYNSDPSI